MSFIWLLCKVILAIEGYNIIVDYIITKKAFNDIKKEYNFLIKPKYNIRDNLSFNILIDIISIHTKLKYYHEFKSLLIEEFLNENNIADGAELMDDKYGLITYASGKIPVSEVTILRRRKDLPVDRRRKI